MQEHCAGTRTLCQYKNTRTVLISKYSLLLNVRTLCVTRINFMHFLGYRRNVAQCPFSWDITATGQSIPAFSKESSGSKRQQ
jgi:hypothetical protein